MKHPALQRWQAQMHETNRAAGAYLQGQYPLERLNMMFDHESVLFQRWVEEAKPYDKDWTEDHNR